MRLRLSLLLLIGSFAAYFGLSMLAVACTDSTALTGIAPITGIQVRSDVISAGKGCGKADTQVFKYVAVVTDYDGYVRAAATYDCFADGVFQALEPSDSQRLDFDVDVYAFNFKDFGDGVAVAGVVGNVINADHFRDRFWAGRTLKFTWVTACQSTQQSSVEVVAVCEALRNAGADGKLVLPTASFAGGSGSLNCPGDYTSVQAALRALPPAQPSTDGGTDGGSDASADAGDASADAGDAGTDAGEAGDGGDAGDAGPGAALSVTAACPQDITFGRIPAPADHVIDVVLLRPNPDAAAPPLDAGRTVCRGTTAPFESSALACDPVQ